MSLFESDVEFFNAANTSQAELKAAIWRDSDFTAYVAEVGLEGALYEVADFHRNVANQCKDREAHLHLKEDGPVGDWSRRAVSLTMRLKSRRQQLKRAVREAYDDGWDRVDKITKEVSDDWSD